MITIDKYFENIENHIHPKRINLPFDIFLTVHCIMLFNEVIIVQISLCDHF